MKSIITTIAAGMMVLAAVAGNPNEKIAKEQKLRVDNAASTVYWTGKKVTGEHTGTIDIKEGYIMMTDGVPTSATITMDMKTIVVTDITDPKTNGDLVGHLNSPDFFNVSEFASGTFVAKTIKPIAGAKEREPNYTLTGTLTLKGITKDISFPAYISVKDGKLTANGKLTFDRAKYDIRYGSGSFFDDLGDKVIYDDVELSFVLGTK